MGQDIRYLNKLQIYTVQIVFATSISLSYQSVSLDNSHEWGGIIARYIICLYFIRATREAVVLSHSVFSKGVDVVKLFKEYKKHIVIFVAALGLLVRLKQRIFGEEFLLLLVADLISTYPDMEKQSRLISYGTGMACSFFEGYLAHVLPSDGHRFVGFEENIRLYEANQSIRFPVKRLFVIMTKSLYCPPDLKAFNKENNPELPYMEACGSLEDVTKCVAGVRNRTYRNSAYKIIRAGARPVYIAAECATPLHTLYMVLKNRTLYQELEGINEAEVVRDFSTMLASILEKSHECRHKCELVYYDNTNPDLNLADVLLERVKQLAPNFEDLIKAE